MINKEEKAVLYTDENEHTQNEMDNVWKKARVSTKK